MDRQSRNFEDAITDGDDDGGNTISRLAHAEISLSAGIGGSSCSRKSSRYLALGYWCSSLAQLFGFLRLFASTNGPLLRFFVLLHCTSDLHFLVFPSLSFGRPGFSLLFFFFSFRRVVRRIDGRLVNGIAATIDTPLLLTQLMMTEL